MKTHFYDIETLSNVFTVAIYQPEVPCVYLYYLLDDSEILGHPSDVITHPETGKEIRIDAYIDEYVRAKNYNLNGPVYLRNLDNPRSYAELARTFGISDARHSVVSNENSSFPDDWAPVPTTSPQYDPDKHPYLLGYNSYNYDTTMLALYFYETNHREEKYQIALEAYKKLNDYHKKRSRLPERRTTAKAIRNMNDDLFDSFRDNMPEYLRFKYENHKWEGPDWNDPRHYIRRNMLNSGRHVDVARLNEIQSRVGLKRLMGLLGLQILESDKLSHGKDHIGTFHDFCELVAYNVSDVVNLHELFKHPTYSGTFQLKKQLLETYPETIYKKDLNEYKPDINPESVKTNRLRIDSTSAQFVTMVLAPYNKLTDYETVNFLYPHKDIADEMGIEQIDVLDASRDFFYENFKDPKLRERFDEVYAYYNSIRGKNFNTSDKHKEDYTKKVRVHKGYDHKTKQDIFEWETRYPKTYKIKNIPKRKTTLPYFDKDGKETSCFVNFSTGGVHGAEANVPFFKYEKSLWYDEMSHMTYVRSIYQDRPQDLKRDKRITLKDGTSAPAGRFLKSGATLSYAEYKPIEDREPELYIINNKGNHTLNDRYTYTSFGVCNHEDFKSYYPYLLQMMKAFHNPMTPYDNYAEILKQKDEYDVLRKDPSLTEEERERYHVLREGTKLILNSASGAGDTAFDSNILITNKIISMRIMGQLFAWRIGQAQTLEGARIVSTNTDGLYSIMEEKLNNEILARESERINLAIEPKPLFLVSKDSNNRLEASVDTETVYSTSGGSLACADGPNPSKSLTVPAVVHWTLQKYLLLAAQGKEGCSLDEDFNMEVGMRILKSTKDLWEPVKWLNMFQNVIASSIGSITYIFGVDPEDKDHIHWMQHYNRVFIMKDGTPRTSHLQAAAAKTISKTTKAKRARDPNESEIQNDPYAYKILNMYGIEDIPYGREAAIRKVTNIEMDWYMRIENRGLAGLSDEEQQEIMENIDYDKYLGLVKHSFERNWQNATPVNHGLVLKKRKAKQDE